MRWFARHLGDTVSALVDGQLGPEESEQAWRHVVQCPACRRLVEREGWVKRQLAWRPQVTESPSQRLLGNLYDLGGPAPVAHPRGAAVPAARSASNTAETREALEAWAAVEALEQRGRPWRRAGIALVGAGSVSAAVFGLSALSTAPLGIGGAPAGSPASALSRGAATAVPTRAVVAPRARAHGLLPGWHVQGTGVATRAVAVDDGS